MDHNVTIHARSSSRAAARAMIKRGEASWSYIYVFLGFVVGIEGTFISMVRPWKYPSNVEIFAAVLGLSVYFFLFNGWFQERVIRLKSWYEGKEH